MKCSKVRKEIDRWIYQHEPDPGAEIYSHIESCKACARYLEGTRLASGKIAGLRLREPILKNPGVLTEDIMKAIRDESKMNHPHISEKSGRYTGIIILQRLLAAASVCLFLVFAYEEYIVVDKISRLEKQNAAISQSSRYQAVLKLKKAMSILASDPQMINQYKELKTKKINIRTLLKAAMYADMAGINPDALKWLNMTDYNFAKPPFISINKEFDSTHHTKQR